MFQLFDPEKEEAFTWDSVGDIIDGRQNLGEEMPVFVYRLVQYTMKDVLTKQVGREQTVDIFRKAGYLAGVAFAKNLLDLSLAFSEFIAHLQKTLEDSKIGILRIEEFDEESGRAVLTLGEDLACSGLPVTGEMVCSYDEGFLAGILKEYTKREYIVREVDCWATGSRVCRFEAFVKSDL